MRDDIEDAAAIVAVTVIVVAVVLAVIVGSYLGIKGLHRSQVRADANNRVKVTTIEVRNAQQQARVVAARDQIVKAQAQQRYLAAVGIRRAQDEVAKTLTPLYVQFEAVQAQLKAAQSDNHTVIYVPAGTNGTPVLTDEASGR